MAAVTQALSRFGVGASEIAAACGISRYRTRFGLWLEKTGRAPGFAGNFHTRLGQLCEPHIRQLYANARHDAVEIPPASVFHPEHPWARCTPDGIVLPHRTRLLQIKAMGYFTGRRLRFDGPPVEIEAQCQWEMFVTGAEEVDLAILIGSDRLEWERFVLGEIENPADVFSRAMLEVFPVYRDEAAIASLFAGARAFMDLVDSDTQPPVDYSAECRDFLNGKRLDAIVASIPKSSGSPSSLSPSLSSSERSSTLSRSRSMRPRIATASGIALAATSGSSRAARIAAKSAPSEAPRIGA